MSLSLADDVQSRWLLTVTRRVPCGHALCVFPANPSVLPRARGADVVGAAGVGWVQQAGQLADGDFVAVATCRLPGAGLTLLALDSLLDSHEIEAVLGALALNIWFDFDRHGLRFRSEIMRKYVQAVFTSQSIRELTARGTVRAGSGL